MINVLEQKKNYLIVGRAATAVYLILKSKGIIGRKVIVPANICYAVIFPIIYSGNTPVFCDVDSLSGNLDYKTVSQKVENAAVAILPHMYGNPIKDIKEICDLCKKNNVISIEDCASAMGAETQSRMCGSFGDYVIYSTGYSKTIDLGYGGMIASDNDLSLIRDMYECLPLKTLEDEANEAFFSKLYRLIRNNSSQTVSGDIIEGLTESMKRVFVHKMNISDELFLDEMNKLQSVIDQRRSEASLYSHLLSKNPYVMDYHFEKGAVPWRYCFFVPPKEKKSVVEYLLDKNVPVSDWYPDVTKIFGYAERFKGVVEMESRILNLPLMIGEEKIRSICNTMNKIELTKEHD